ncbi:MAG: hypothetical protein ACYDAL_10580 [Candidatus Dormibacteraceae bacterium]
MAEQTLDDRNGGREPASADLKDLIDHWVQVIDRWVQHVDQGMGGTVEGADPATVSPAPEAGMDVPRLESS